MTVELAELVAMNLRQIWRNFLRYVPLPAQFVFQGPISGPISAHFDHAYKHLSWRRCGVPMAQDNAPMRQASEVYVEEYNLSSKKHVKLDIKALCIKRHLKWKHLYDIARL